MVHNYMNSQEFQNNLSLLKPEVYQDLIQRYGNQRLGILEILKSVSGFHYGSQGSEIIQHIEQDWIRDLVLLGSASASVSPGDPVTYTIPSGGKAAIHQTEPYIDAGNAALDENKMVARVGNIVQYSNGVFGLVTNVNESNGTITIHPTDENQSLPATSASTAVPIVGSLTGELSTSRKGVTSRFIGFTNQMLHIRDDIEVSHRAAGNPTWVRVPDKSGKLQWKFYLLEFANTCHRVMGEAEMQFLIGRTITNPAIAALGGEFKTMQTTLGLLPMIQDSGVNLGYDEGNLDLDDYNALFKSMNRGKAHNNLLGVFGWDFYRETSKLAREGDGLDFGGSGSNARLVMGSFNGRGQQGVKLDMDKFIYMGYEVKLHKADAFNDEKTLGAVPIYEKLGLFLPLGKTVAYNKDDRTTAREVPTIRIVEKDNNLGYVGYHEWLTGVAPSLGIQTNDKLGLELHVDYNAGLEVFGINRFGMMSPNGVSS